MDKFNGRNRWQNTIENLVEIWWKNLVVKLGDKLGGNIVLKNSFEKIGETHRLNNLCKKLVKRYLKNLLYKFGEKLIGKKFTRIFFEKLVYIFFFLINWVENWVEN